MEEVGAEVELEKDIQQSPLRDGEVDKRGRDRQQLQQLPFYNCSSESGLSHGYGYLIRPIIERQRSELPLRYR